MNNTLVVIMAHQGGQETFNRHLPYWETHQCDILVYSPSNAPILTTHQQLLWGHATHHSDHANERFVFLLKVLTKMHYDGFIIFEYDAICLDPQFLPTQAMLCSYGANIFHDNRPERGFKGTTFTHPPLWFTRNGLLSIVEHNLPYTEELGFWDRWLGYCLERIGAKPYDWLSEGKGYAKNTIEPADYDNMACAIRHGAVMLHGVKSAECLAVIQNAWKIRLQQSNGVRNATNTLSLVNGPIP